MMRIRRMRSMDHAWWLAYVANAQLEHLVAVVCSLSDEQIGQAISLLRRREVHALDDLFRQWGHAR